MSEPVIFVFVRDGLRRGFGDRWAGTMQKREVLWGPKVLEDWATQLEPLDDDEIEFGYMGVVVDYDKKTMKWSGDESFQIPAIRDCYEEILQSTWAGFTIQTDPAENIFGHDQHADVDEENEFDACRPENLAEAAGSLLEDDDDDDDYEYFENDEPRVWLTLIDQPNKMSPSSALQTACEHSEARQIFRQTNLAITSRRESSRNSDP